MSISNKDYLNKLIAKAKKSWEGVDADSYMKNLREEPLEKEETEELQKALDNFKKAIEKSMGK